MIIISIELFWPKSEQLFNKIFVFCLFNSIILKIMHRKSIKRLIGKKGNSLKFNFLLYNIKYIDI